MTAKTDGVAARRTGARATRPGQARAETGEQLSRAGPGENQTTADRGAGIEILSMPAGLDLDTDDGLVEQGYAAIARSSRLLRLDLAGRSQGVHVGRGRHARDPQSSFEAGDVMTVPVAGQPGHGITASIRRQPVRILQGGKDGGYSDAFEVVCGDCGDHLYWDYAEISLSLQRTRGPYTTMAAALAAYDQHLGLTTARRRS
jgi:hypothetical protein